MFFVKFKLFKKWITCIQVTIVKWLITNYVVTPPRHSNPSSFKSIFYSIMYSDVFERPVRTILYDGVFTVLIYVYSLCRLHKKITTIDPDFAVSSIRTTEGPVCSSSSVIFTREESTQRENMQLHRPKAQHVFFSLSLSLYERKRSALSRCVRAIDIRPRPNFRLGSSNAAGENICILP